MNKENQMPRYYITGNTFPHKESIRALGGRWDALRRAWYTTDEVAFNNATWLTDPSKYVPPPPRSPPRRIDTNFRPCKYCIECGNHFSEISAKEAGGVWSESYCGC